MLDDYGEFCYDQVGDLALDNIEMFQGLNPKLDRANIQMSLPEYVSVIIFSTIMVGIVSMVLLLPILVLVSGIIAVLYSLAASILLSGATFVVFYTYPNIRMRDRASKIDDNLPFATLYMSTMTGTGTELTDVFESLSKREEYGEVAAEAGRIHQEVETFGTDISEAIKKAAERSPSDNFQDLMWGMNHVLTSGGDLRSFLDQRSESLMTDYERRVEEFGQKLGLLVQMYITLVVLGSIVFISMSVVMSTFTGVAPTLIVLIQVLAIFIGLPLISLMFIILVKGITPGGVE